MYYKFHQLAFWLYSHGFYQRMILSLQTNIQVHGEVRGGAQPAESVKIIPVTNKVADITTRLPLHPLCFSHGF